MPSTSATKQTTIESLFPPLSTNDGGGKPTLVRGAECKLTPLRRCDPPNHSIPATTTAIDENDDDINVNETCDSDQQPQEQEQYQNERETLLFYLPSVNVTLTDASSSSSFTNIGGMLYVTTRRIFFVAPSEQDKRFDLAVDAACISLHAMTCDPHWSVYCQLSSSMVVLGETSVNDDDNNDNSGDSGDAEELRNRTTPPPLDEDDGHWNNDNGHDEGEEAEEDLEGLTEISFTPQLISTHDSSSNEHKHTEEEEEEYKRELCQNLFDSLSKLASLNPVLNDDDNDDCGGFAAMLNMMAMASGGGGGGGGGLYPYEGGDEDDYYDDGEDSMVCRIDPNSIVTAWDDDELPQNGGGGDRVGEVGASSSSQRQNLLDRLDDMLVVPPEYEVGEHDGGKDGQFDDANEHDSDDNDLL